MLQHLTRTALKISAATLGVTLSLPAFASMGTVDCANSNGSLRRTEKEVWGENVVTWTYGGKILQQSQISVLADPVVVNEEINLHPDLGEERVIENVQRVEVTLADAEVISTFILCKSLSYPNAYDF